jgi:iron complex transport system permease protein
MAAGMVHGGATVTPVRYGVLLAVLLALLALALAVGLVIGHASLADLQVRAVLLDLRLARGAAAGLAGAALAVAGVLMQGLFRNPLASSSVLGADAGASLGGQTALIVHGLCAAWLPAWIVPELALPLGCLAGAALALTALVLLVGRGAGLATLLLMGVILTTLCGSLSALLVSLAQDSWQLGRALIAFGLGSVDGKGLRHLALGLPLVTAGVAAAWWWGRGLDLMLCGEEEAAALGVDTRALAFWCLAWCAVLTGAAVALGGGVAFVGLIVPHALRPFAGSAHRRLVPAAALGGAAFLVACDDLARTLPATGEVPLGVITGLLGAPLFIAILLRTRRELGW